MTRIVVGADATPAGSKALLWAVRAAAAQDASLTVVRAWSSPTSGGIYALSDELISQVEQDACAQAEGVAEELLKKAVEEVLGSERLAYDVRTPQGPAAPALVEAARGADLLVVGTRGAGLLSRALIGSVSTAVLHHATVPVAVVPASAEALAAGRVVAGVDHSPESAVALRVAAGLAAERHAALVPVYVRDDSLAFGPGVDGASLEASECASLRSAAEAAGAKGVVEPQVVVGHPVAELARLVGPQDVLVLGSRGRGGFAGLLLGSTSTHSAQHAVGAVLVVPSS